MRKAFARHALLLFAALRAGDLVSLAAGLWFVPKFVSSAEIGAVLPIASFATFLSLPLFALAMTAMKESAFLHSAGERGKLKSLLAGVFISVAAMTCAGLAAAAMIAPRFLSAMGVGDRAAGMLAVAAALLGCAAPVYTDALQALKRFRALGAVEALGAVVRFLVMAAVMPARALAGYFAGVASLPAFRIFGGILALRRDFAVKAEPYWTPPALRRFALTFAAVLAYQAFPMFAALVEQSVLRTSLPAADSAGYYMVSRFSDLLYYVTTPLLLVAFPYAAHAAQSRGETRWIARRCCALTLLAAAAMVCVYIPFGGRLLSMLPSGTEYLGHARHMPLLVVATALTTCQVFCTNVEVSAGRFGFLWWLAPLHAAYPLALWLFPPSGMQAFVWWLVAVSAARFALAALSCHVAWRYGIIASTLDKG